MNVKLALVIWMAFFVSTGVAEPDKSPATTGWVYYCYPPWGNAYASTITEKMLAASPEWADSEPDPPLSARKAMALAERTYSAVAKGEPIREELERELAWVRLVPLGKKKWCWEVRYQWHIRLGASSGTPSDFRVFVLMNGDVVQPEKQTWAEWRGEGDEN